uniref:Uncharacterized protein n=1 Tax=Anopheles farauti TaxID=69004 RepID=A0A182PZK1_9DIPT
MKYILPVVLLMVLVTFALVAAQIDYHEPVLDEEKLTKREIPEVHWIRRSVLIANDNLDSSESSTEY